MWWSLRSGSTTSARKYPAHRFVEQTALLWSELQQRTGARWAVVSGLPPMHLLTAVPHPLRWYLGRYACVAGHGTVRDWASQQGLGYCALRFPAGPGTLARDGFHPGPTLYPQWAERLAEIVVVGRPRWARPQ